MFHRNAMTTVMIVIQTLFALGCITAGMQPPLIFIERRMRDTGDAWQRRVDGLTAHNNQSSKRAAAQCIHQLGKVGLFKT